MPNGLKNCQTRLKIITLNTKFFSPNLVTLDGGKSFKIGRQDRDAKTEMNGHSMEMDYNRIFTEKEREGDWTYGLGVGVCV